MDFLELKPYSLRRGGATWFFEATGNLSLTLERGRWAHSNTAKTYLVSGLAAMQSAHIPSQLDAEWNALARFWL